MAKKSRDEIEAFAAAEHPDTRAAPFIGGDDQVGNAIAIEIARGDEDAEIERVLEGLHAEQFRTVGAIEDANSGADARPSANNEIGDAVAVEVGGSGANAAGEAGVEGGEGSADSAIGVI